MSVCSGGQFKCAVSLYSAPPSVHCVLCELLYYNKQTDMLVFLNSSKKKKKCLLRSCQPVSAGPGQPPREGSENSMTKFVPSYFISSICSGLPPFHHRVISLILLTPSARFHPVPHWKIFQST